MALYAIIFAVLGARMYFVIFNWDYYVEDLTRILNIREGGLGIYGGIIAAIITVFILTRRKKLDFGLVCMLLHL